MRNFGMMKIYKSHLITTAMYVYMAVPLNNLLIYLLTYCLAKTAEYRVASW
jgi:hypothetical protein